MAKKLAPLKPDRAIVYPSTPPIVTKLVTCELPTGPSNFGSPIGGKQGTASLLAILEAVFLLIEAPRVSTQDSMARDLGLSVRGVRGHFNRLRALSCPTVSRGRPANGYSLEREWDFWAAALDAANSPQTALGQLPAFSHLRQIDRAFTLLVKQPAGIDRESLALKLGCSQKVVAALMAQLASLGCSIEMVGRYNSVFRLSPSHPEDFDLWAAIAASVGVLRESMFPPAV
jgi:biotin operon repressor